MSGTETEREWEKYVLQPIKYNAIQRYIRERLLEFKAVTWKGHTVERESWNNVYSQVTALGGGILRTSHLLLTITVI